MFARDMGETYMPCAHRRQPRIIQKTDKKRYAKFIGRHTKY